MNALNLYLFTRVPWEDVTAYENSASNRNKPAAVRMHEFYTVRVLVQILLEQGVSISDLDGFFYSFCIEQIGKEFDLLKVDDRRKVLNIELKSEAVSEEKMEAQLRRNRYYLKHISEEPVLFTFAESTRKVYTLKDGIFRECSLEELAFAVKTFGTFRREGISELFQSGNVLISPHTTPRLFLENQYYLTQQQEQIRMSILKKAAENSGERIFGIAGKAGTGKTLLLYDLAKEFAKTEACLIVICGKLTGGHGYLRQEWREMEICSVYELFRKNVFAPAFRKEDHPREVSCVLFDEADRLTTKMLSAILEAFQGKKTKLVFSYDPSCFPMERTEEAGWIELLEETGCFAEYRLSDRIRSGSALLSFFRTMVDLKDRAVHCPDYSPVTVLYAEGMEEARQIVAYWQERDPGCLVGELTMRYRYEFLHSLSGGEWEGPRFDTEYDAVLLLLDEILCYNEDGKLTAKKDVIPMDQVYRYLYQAVSRARERLCILVIGNEMLFKRLIGIKYRKGEDA